MPSKPIIKIKINNNSRYWLFHVPIWKYWEQEMWIYTVPLTINCKSQENSWIDPINTTPCSIPNANCKKNWVGKPSSICSDNFPSLFSVCILEDRALAREQYFLQGRQQLGVCLRDYASFLAHTWPINCLIINSPTHFLLASFHFQVSLRWCVNTYFPPQRLNLSLSYINITLTLRQSSCFLLWCKISSGRRV